MRNPGDLFGQRVDCFDVLAWEVGSAVPHPETEDRDIVVTIFLTSEADKFLRFRFSCDEALSLGLHLIYNAMLEQTAQDAREEPE